MLFSATMNAEVTQLANLSLNKPLRVNVDPPRTINPNVQQQFVFTDGELVDKLSILVHLLNNSFSSSKTIVFCENRHQVSTIQQNLLALDYDDFNIISSDLSQSQRHAQLNEFDAREGGLLIATDLAARGLDLQNIEVVILFNTPKNIDEYIHRVGRTGRYHSKGCSVCIGKREEIKALVQQLGSRVGLQQRELDTEQL